MAHLYAEHYGLLPFAGSDNHTTSAQARLGGMEGNTRIANEADFVRRVLHGEMTPFVMDNPME